MKNTLFAFAALAMFCSCGGEQVSQKKEYDYEKADSLSDEYMRNLGDIRVSIENTAQLNLELKNGGYSFNSSALNPAGKVGSYSNSKSQALGMGMFGADLNYISIFEQTQQISDYTKALMDLANKMGLQSAFDEELISKLTSNDTTINKSILLTKAFVKAEDNLHSEDRAALATLMVTGGWVEGLHIAVSNVANKPGTGAINKKIWEHAYTFKNVVALLNVFKDKNQDCAAVLTTLQSIAGPVNAVIDGKGNPSQESLVKLSEVLTSARNTLAN